MGTEEEAYDYHGALVVVVSDDGGVVLIHPLRGPPHAPASPRSDPCRPDEDPVAGAVRIVKEKTGLDVAIEREFTTFIQEGTPTGTMCAHGFVARITGGELLDDGPDGPARIYSLAEMPAIMPIRVANQRTLAEYLRQRDST